MKLAVYRSYKTLMGQLHVNGGILMSMNIERDVTSGLLWTSVFCMDYVWEWDLNSVPVPYCTVYLH